jgi:hypothetical protein
MLLTLVVCVATITVLVVVGLCEATQVKVATSKAAVGQATVVVENQCESGVFLNCGSVDVNRSATIVHTAPVSNYFDTLGGQYRFGILGDHVKDLFPELTSPVEKIYYHGRDKSDSTIVQTTGIDSNMVFMHTLVEIQAAIAQVERANGDLNQLSAEIHRFGDRLDALFKRYLNDGNNLESMSDIHEKYNLNQMELASLEDEINHITDMTAAAKSVSLHRLHTRKANMLEADKRLTAQLRNHFEALRNISLDKLASIDKLLRAEVQAEHDIEERQLQRDIQVEINALRDEISTAIKSAQFRIAEETDIERRNEDIYANILQAREDSRRKASNEMIVVFFQEVNRYMKVVLDNPRDLLLWSSNLLVVVSIFVVIVEVVTASKNMLLNSLTPPFGVNFVRGKKNDKKITSSKSEHMRLVEQLRENTEGDTDDAIASIVANYEPAFAGSTECMKELELTGETMEAICRVAATLNSHQAMQNQDNSKISILSRCVRPLLGNLASNSGRDQCYLPNTLVRGPGGSGKSLVAQAIAEASGLPYAVICGADLEAHGARASAFLRTVLDRLQGRSTRCILIIDDPENIVEGRGAAAHTGAGANNCGRVEDWDAVSVASGSNFGFEDDDRMKAIHANSNSVDVAGSGGIPYCLYVLLQALRNNSRSYGVIVTTSLDLHNVDAALLDRYGTMFSGYDVLSLLLLFYVIISSEWIM